MPKERLLAVPGVVFLHSPLTERISHLISRERLVLMKPTSVLINTSRGPIVDQNALEDALFSGQIAGAGLDVLKVEPPTGEIRLMSAPHCLITPHIE